MLLDIEIHLHLGMSGCLIVCRQTNIDDTDVCTHTDTDASTRTQTNVRGHRHRRYAELHTTLLTVVLHHAIENILTSLQIKIGS